MVGGVKKENKITAGTETKVFDSSEQLKKELLFEQFVLLRDVYLVNFDETIYRNRGNEV